MFYLLWVLLFVFSSVSLVQPVLASNLWLSSCLGLWVAKVTGGPPPTHHPLLLARVLYELVFANWTPRSHQNKGIAAKDPEQVF